MSNTEETTEEETLATEENSGEEETDETTTEGTANPALKGIREYPDDVAKILTDIKYQKSTLALMSMFEKTKPWNGTLSERIGKLYFLHNNLCKIYGLGTALFVMPNVVTNSSSGSSYYSGAFNAIVLNGKVSVLTYLHEFAHALRGGSEELAVEWSVNLFRKFFPERFERLASSGHFLSND